jgi:hypothetical protein
MFGNGRLPAHHKSEREQRPVDEALLETLGEADADRRPTPDHLAGHGRRGDPDGRATPARRARTRNGRPESWETGIFVLAAPASIMLITI